MKKRLKKQMTGEDETCDTFYHGRVQILQKKGGFRFSIDAPLLADFIQTKEADRLLELGTGSGIIALLLSIKPFARLTALEIQPDLVNLARRNVRLNNLEDRIQVIQADLRTYASEQKYDIVFSNPPYIKKKSGYLSPSAQKSVAKHELKCTIFDIMQKTGEWLKLEGMAYFIYPAIRIKDFMQAAEDERLKIRSFRPVHPYRDSEPNFFLVSCDRLSQEPRHLPPLILYEREGKYTEEAERIFSGRTNDPAL